MTKNIAYPRFISNAPIGEDLYESQSQKRIATSIVNHIISNSSDTTLIGLDGEWGSGKSNAISIIKNELGAGYHVFIYDTWAHQEDLQRRSFLEEFTDDLFVAKLIDQEIWSQKLKTLLAKKKESVKRTIPKLSNAIVVSIISLILIPIVKLFTDLTALIWLKFLFASIPLLILVGFWLYKWKKGDKLSLQDLFFIYKEKDLEEISKETIAEDEPSVRKFKSWLSDLSGALSKEVIIVFDNMDRLPSDKIKTIWTLIHTFFSSTPFKKMNVIVPFDRKHIQNAFGEVKENDDEKVNHFINKTFSVIFKIPPGILTDWKNLFRTKYNEAFGSAEDTEFLVTRQLFNIHNRYITPRKIISFINDLVSYKLIWKEEISLRYIALFVLNRENISRDPVKNILEAEYLIRSKTLFGGDDTVADKMSALFYNLKLEIAGQVTLQREIEFAIREGRYEDLKEYKNNPNFLTILDQIEINDIPVENSVLALEELQLDQSIADNKSQISVLWDRIMGRQMQVKIESLDLKYFHEILIKNCLNEKKKKIVYYFIKQFYDCEAFDGAAYFTTLNDLKTIATELTPPIDISFMLKEKTVDSVGFVDYLDIAQDEYPYFKVKTSLIDLENFYLEQIPDNIQFCSSVLNLKEKHTFKKIKNKIEKLIENDDVTLENTFLIFSIYKGVNNAQLTFPLTKKVSDVKINSLLNSAEKDSLTYHELVSMRMARGGVFEGAGAVSTNVTQLQDAILIDSVSEKIQDYNNIGAIILDCLSSKYPLTISVLKKNIANKKGRVLAIKNIISKFKAITDTVQVTDMELFLFLSPWYDSFAKELETESIQTLVPDIVVYDCALKTDIELSETILSYALKHIDSATEIDYSSALMDSESFLFQLLHVFLKNNKINTLPDEAFAAYKAALKSISNSTDNEFLTSMNNEMWEELYLKSDKSHLQPVIKDIRDYFLRKADITDHQFVFFEEMFRQVGSLNEFAGEVVRKILMPIIDNVECLEIIASQGEFYSELINSAGNDAFELIDKIRDNVEGEHESENYVKLDQLIHSKFAENLQISKAEIQYDKNGAIEFIDILPYFKKIVFEDRRLHFHANDLRTMDNFPETDQFTLYISYSINSQQKELVFESSKWVRIP